jgi:hypothetical protein
MSTGIINIILVESLSYNLLQLYLYNLFFRIFLLFFSFIILSCYDDIPINNFKEIIDNIKNDKINLLIISFPISVVLLLFNIFIDPITLQIFMSTTVVFNYIMSIILNKTKYNIGIILYMLVNIYSCLIPIIFSNSIINQNYIYIILLILMLIINGIKYSIIERKSNIDEKNIHIYNILYYILPEAIYLILGLPIFVIIQKYYYSDLCLNLTKMNEIISYSCLSSMILIFVKQFTSVSLKYLDSTDNGLIQNLSSILITVICIIIGISKFNYLYIISFFFIIISTYLINYFKKEIISNNKEIISNNKEIISDNIEFDDDLL